MIIVLNITCRLCNTAVFLLLAGTWQCDLGTWRQVQERLACAVPGLEADTVAAGFTWWK